MPALRCCRAPGEWSASSLQLVGEDGAELVHFFQCSTRAAHHAGERVFGNDYGQAGFFHQQAVEVAQQRTAAGQHHAALGDVGAEFRRGLFQRSLDRLDDARQGFLQGFEDFVAVEREAARQTFRQIAALDLDFAHFVAGIGAADLELDALGGGVTDERAVVAAYVVDDGVVEAINERKEEFGFDRFCKIIADNMLLSSDQLVKKIFREVKTFAGSEPQYDDFTLMIIKVLK